MKDYEGIGITDRNMIHNEILKPNSSKHIGWTKMWSMVEWKHGDDTGSRGVSCRDRDGTLIKPARHETRECWRHATNNPLWRSFTSIRFRDQLQTPTLLTETSIHSGDPQQTSIQLTHTNIHTSDPVQTFTLNIHCREHPFWWPLQNIHSNDNYKRPIFWPLQTSTLRTATNIHSSDNYKHLLFWPLQTSTLLTTTNVHSSDHYKPTFCWSLQTSTPEKSWIGDLNNVSSEHEVLYILKAPSLKSIIITVRTKPT